jgi:hypothetical protein
MVLVLTSASKCFGWQIQAMTWAHHVAELLELAQAHESHEVLDVLSVGPPDVGVGKVGESFKLGECREGLKLRGGQVRQQGSRGGENRGGRHGMASMAE